MNETIYHYTNLDAFIKIIENKELWFTRVDSLNDQSEYKYYDEIFEIALNQYLSETNFTNTYNEQLITKYIYEFLIKPRKEFYKKTFISSLTTDKDSIPLWNYYSGQTGVAIGFNRELIINALKKHTDTYYALTNSYIIYNKNDQVKFLKYQFDNIIKIADDTMQKGLDFEESLRQINNILGYMWNESHMFKDFNFQYENETRISLCKLDTNLKNKTLDKVYFVPTKNNIKPIIKIKAFKNWNNIITNIVISPFNTSEIIIDNIYDFLICNKVKINKINIEKSNCPIRNL